MNDLPNQPKHARLTRDIAVRILTGEYPVGHRLPVEADLIEGLQVSRTALREGLRTLAAKGLVVSRKRLGTMVNDRDKWNLLDPDVLGWMDNTDIHLDFLRQVSEARLIFEPQAARLAARRATAVQVAEIETAFTAMTAADTETSRIDADVAFHVGILNASQNHVLQNFGAIIRTALRASFRLSDQATESYTNTLDLHGAVLRAIRLQDEENASQRMFELLNKSVADLGLRPLAMPAAATEQ
ncbi:hypothetical protein ACMU_05925 [Actibacterium mucosum KCTC 23349]|uniref:HTH gntR-type domain-containing protein n=1 Tax=Actibacterium mucosum KCTC 23349 TaxID=1454373 RepID=A0A037ZK54_9RHOB|nr:FadR/GntR family transcriptional regulator [Actibacterium mucosum]KAJ56478.1 hypothetical protein ACMU_05925 [Actibacterium mucosum KCTC 23349]